MPCRVDCIPMTPVILLTARAKKCISTPSAIRCRDRVWPIKASQVVVDHELHNELTCLGGARGNCPRSKVSMMIMGVPQSGQT